MRCNRPQSPLSEKACLFRQAKPPRRAAFYVSWVIALGADASVGGNGHQGVPQLGQNRAQEIEFILRQLTGEGIGHGGDGSGQFTGIHGRNTSLP